MSHNNLHNNSNNNSKNSSREVELVLELRVSARELVPEAMTGRYRCTDSSSSASGAYDFKLSMSSLRMSHLVRSITSHCVSHNLTIVLTTAQFSPT